MSTHNWKGRLTVAAIVTAAVVAVASPAGALFVRFQTGSSPNDGASHNILNAVSETAGMTFAVGTYDDGTTWRTLVEQSTGLTWNLMASDNNGVEQNELFGVAAVSPTIAYAVGAYYNYASWHTLAERWNGTAWKVVYSPTIVPHDNWLMSVAASSSTSGWAVGYYLNGAAHAQRTLIEHFDGSRWKIVTSPNGGGGDNYLTGVAIVPGTGGTQAWAVGYFTKDKVAKNLVEHLSGGVWEVVPSVTVGAQPNWLNGVSAFSPRSAYTVGWYEELRGGKEVRQTLVEVWNGSSWRVVPSANLGAGENDLEAVVERGPRNVFAFGHYLNGQHFQTLVERLRRGTFVVVPSPDVNSNRNVLLGASYAPGEPIMAVGTYDSGSADRTLIEVCPTC